MNVPLLTASHPGGTDKGGPPLGKPTKQARVQSTMLSRIILRIQRKARSHQLRPSSSPACAPSLRAPTAWHQTADGPSEQHLTRKGPTILSPGNGGSFPVAGQPLPTMCDKKQRKLVHRNRDLNSHTARRVTERTTTLIPKVVLVKSSCTWVLENLPFCIDLVL